MMKFKDLLKKLKASEQFESFSNAYKDAYIIAGFFVMDFETKKNIIQIDYYIKAKKKVAAFSLEDRVSMQLLDSPDTKDTLKELDTNVKIDLDELSGILDDEMKNRGISESLKKIVAVLHMNDENKLMWNLNCMLSGMTLLRAHVEDESKTVSKMEKVSLFDVVKQMPGAKQMGQQPSAQQVSAQNLKNLKPAEKKQLMKSELEKLDKLEVAIEKEKAVLKKELDKNSETSKADTKTKKK